MHYYGISYFVESLYMKNHKLDRKHRGTDTVRPRNISIFKMWLLCKSWTRLIGHTARHNRNSAAYISLMLLLKKKPNNIDTNSQKCFTEYQIALLWYFIFCWIPRYEKSKTRQNRHRYCTPKKSCLFLDVIIVLKTWTRLIGHTARQNRKIQTDIFLL